MEPKTRIIPISIEGDTTMFVQATILSGEQDISARKASFEGVNKAIEEICANVTKTIEKVKPDSATVEFGIELAMDSGCLTAVLIKGNTTASMKITLEWKKS